MICIISARLGYDIFTGNITKRVARERQRRRCAVTQPVAKGGVGRKASLFTSAMPRKERRGA
jgi:hypothetical protein